ncbi:MAG: hypothetical protein D6812_04950, partial [Deltaproteobacteria bacterium]
MDCRAGQPAGKMAAKDPMVLQEEEDDRKEDRIERTASPRNPVAGQIAKFDRASPTDLLEVESCPPLGEGKVDRKDPAMRDALPRSPRCIGRLAVLCRPRRRLDPLDAQGLSSLADSALRRREDRMEAAVRFEVRRRTLLLRGKESVSLRKLGIESPSRDHFGSPLKGRGTLLREFPAQFPLAHEVLGKIAPCLLQAFPLGCLLSCGDLPSLEETPFLRLPGESPGKFLEILQRLETITPLSRFRLVEETLLFGDEAEEFLRVKPQFSDRLEWAGKGEGTPRLRKMERPEHLRDLGDVDHDGNLEPVAAEGGKGVWRRRAVDHLDIESPPRCPREDQGKKNPLPPPLHPIEKGLDRSLPHLRRPDLLPFGKLDPKKLLALVAQMKARPREGNPLPGHHALQRHVVDHALGQFETPKRLDGQHERGPLEKLEDTHDLERIDPGGKERQIGERKPVRDEPLLAYDRRLPEPPVFDEEIAGDMIDPHGKEEGDLHFTPPLRNLEQIGEGDRISRLYRCMKGEFH